MQEYTQSPADKDPQLWAQARKRAGFKTHLLTYIIVISFLWIVWLLTGSRDSGDGFPWAVWPTLGWGVGIFFHFLGAYAFPKENMVEREYEKLKRDRK